MAEQNNQTLLLPLLITRGLIVFPGTQQIIEAGREFSVNAIKSSKANSDNLIFIFAQKDYKIETPQQEDIFEIGTLCRIVTINQKDAKVKIRVEGIERVVLKEMNFDNAESSYNALCEVKSKISVTPEKNELIIKAISTTLESLPEVVDLIPRTISNYIQREDSDCIKVCYQLLNFFPLSSDRREQAIGIDDEEELMTFTLKTIKGESEKAEIERKINDNVRESTEKSQKEYLLREKLKAIKKELGDEGGNNSPETIFEKLDKNPYPEHIKRKVKAELKKFDMMPSGSLEAALIQGYLDVLMSIPWWQKTEDNDDLNNVEKILDEDHFGLEEPKKRIVEYLAVKKLTGNLKSPILCFYGPPGTGKTSLGKSIARALGRKFFKASLGGISDEAEIRGHRRTYVGAMPGRIIQGMRKAGVTNPVFLLDEIDKLASSYKGDPASALLEVLDPEQNYQFNDNYVEEPYDLSDVLFICTANYLDQIPGPLRDRLELIQLSSYTDIEKLQIAKDHLIKKEAELNGLTLDQITFKDDALKFIIRAYTRESGVRSLERKIASCLRKVAVMIVKDSNIKHVEIDEAKVIEFLGTPLFEDSKKEKDSQIGVVTGLAYTEYGGDILPIEVNYFKGKGNLIITGNLGDVMKESCSIALDYVKANSEKYKIDPALFENNDVHIHVPEGAVPKDGPSAGVAITCAFISCFSKTPANNNVAMTGEVTLRGNALPIGGLKEKSLAALRSGIKTIIVPKENKKDVDELPKEVKETLNIVFMNNVDDAVKVILNND